MNKIDRKDFLKIGWGAVLGGATGFVLSGAPFQALQWAVEWTQDQHVPPRGEEKSVATICQLCPQKCTMSVRMFDDRAVKLETSNTGCPIGQNALQLLYHSERITQPMKRVGKKGSGDFEPVTWDEAIKAITDKMNGLANTPGAVASISKDQCVSCDMLERLVRCAGSAQNYKEPTAQTLSAAALGGFADYDFENTDFILSFGARLLEGWGSQGAMHKALAKWKANGVKLVQVDTNCNRTASLADQWVAVKPGTEAILAMGIANYLITTKRMASAGDGFAKWSQIVTTEYPLPEVAKLTGVDEAKIKELAEAFSRARRPMAVAGKGAHGVSSSAAEIIAVQALNSLVRTSAVTLKKFTALGNDAIAVNDKPAAGLDAFIKNKSFNMLFVLGANPVYKSVIGAELAKKMKDAFVVAIMPIMNDTAAYADYVLPSLTYLEASAVSPQVKAFFAGDIVLKLAAGFKGAAGKFPWAGFADAVKEAGKTTAVGNFSFHADELKGAIADLKKAVALEKNKVFMVPLEHTLIGDGDGLAFPYVLKNIDEHTFFKGDMFVQMNRATAKQLGICEKESVDIESSRGEIGSVKVHLTDLVAPNVVAVPLGFGHDFFTKYGDDKGYNPKTIMSSDIDPVTGVANWWLTRVKIG